MKNARQAIDKLVAQCAICGISHRSIQTTIINNTNDTELIHIRCGACKGSIVALIFNTGKNISSIGVITDLSEKDIMKMKNNKSITHDELMQLHQELTNKNICEAILNNY
ncbi:MAG: hypothetical protein Q8P90_03630 [bacterium]|nr:hypothetical protein [bacterium]